jgi:ferredoxin--NADP+ reductase
MFEVLRNDTLAPNLHRLVISAPRVAKARRAGQFVIVRPREGAERIPLTIADADAPAGTITVIVQALGVSTRAIVDVPPGGRLRDVVGPLGKPTHVEKWGSVVCIGGGVGTAVLYPLAQAAAQAGNDVYVVIGARSSEYVILADEMAKFAKGVFIVTEDGSRGRKGLVTAVLRDMLTGGVPAPAATLPRPDAVFAVGPVPMMEAVAQLTRPENIPTVVSLNPIMIDGTGMCGGCRVMIGGKMKFACVDGPEFDAHQVDFAGLAKRLKMYHRHERQAHADCQIGLTRDQK